jgi:hypothetical protein
MSSDSKSFPLNSAKFERICKNPSKTRWIPVISMEEVYPVGPLSENVGEGRMEFERGTF